MSVVNRELSNWLDTGRQPTITLARLRDGGGTAGLMALNAMMLTSPSHLLLTQNRLPMADEGEKLFASLPAGAGRQDKFLFCAWQQQRLVGCIELIRRWPARDVAYIGILQVREAQLRLGHGTQILEIASHIARGWRGVRRLRLAVAANNLGAIAFWRHVGFQETGQRELRSDFTAPLIVMERSLI